MNSIDLRHKLIQGYLIVYVIQQTNCGLRESFHEQ